MESEQEEQFSICMIGNVNVGKSALIQTYNTEEVMTDKTMPTIGYDFCSKVLEMDGRKIKIILNDTSGSERFFSITKNYIRSGNGIAMVYDITDKGSFEGLRKWYEKICEIRELDYSLLVVGNKADLIEERKVSKEEGSKFAEEIHADFIETSCNNVESVKIAFEMIVKQLYSNAMFKNIEGNMKPRESTVLSRSVEGYLTSVPSSNCKLPSLRSSSTKNLKPQVEFISSKDFEDKKETTKLLLTNYNMYRYSQYKDVESKLEHMLDTVPDDIFYRSITKDLKSILRSDKNKGKPKFRRHGSMPKIKCTNPMFVTPKLAALKKRLIDGLNTPQSRRCSSAVTYGFKAYMFGGISNSLMNDICIFDFHSLKWVKVDFKEPEEDQKNNDDTQNETDSYAIDLHGNIMNPVPEKRFAHSLVKYKNMLILYGGEEKFNISRK